MTPAAIRMVAAVLAVAGFCLCWSRPPTSGAAAAPLPRSVSRSFAAPAAALEISERPLDELDPQVGAFIAGRSGQVSVAVFVPGRQLVYTLGGSQPFVLASVAKVHIMLTLLDAAAREGRELTEDERALLEWMITISDNESASILWDEIGGSEGLGAFMTRSGLGAAVLPEDWEWGTIAEPARDTALLLARLYDGDLMDDASREIALDLLARVDASQRWGVTAGFDLSSEDAPSFYMKDGWYPDEDEGWRVNSAGIIVPRAGEMYVIVVLTTSNDSFEYAVETIEVAASIVNATLGGGQMLVAAAPASQSSGPAAPEPEPPGRQDSVSPDPVGPAPAAPDPGPAAASGPRRSAAFDTPGSADLD